MGAKNRVKLKIADCEILIASEDSEEYIRQTGNRVDEYIRKAMDSSPTMSTTLASIFAALEFCDEATKEKEAADNLRGQIKEALDEVSRLRKELDEVRRSEEEARKELKALKTMNGLKALQEQIKNK
ncbi:hypothetical protein CCDG5_0009 [[Clostridium] cellulosi]|uniref:Cell division protein ZapA n=1 Tax=[Clostridium] cellulosi TaxID=29343 RepID=A0A078KPQ8_9FIRM|nr:MAG: cell division protein ZapA [[Clostridium] cellulosi]CDZ23160.1 hypothetical protein CCDG5_0009 [[Clostridium] cellulosi]